VILKVNHLTKAYKRGDASFYAVRDVSLAVFPGEIVSIIGRSGSGKTTLLNLIAGVLKPTTGSIEIGGRDILSFNDQEASLYRNAAIGYVPQGQSLLANLTVLDNVSLPFYFFKRRGDAAKKAMSLLEQVGVPHLARMYPRQLSGGELRRVTIARALINDPDILMADEPTSDLDEQTTAEVMKLFKQIQNRTAVLMVTHDLEAIHEDARVFRMESGMLSMQVT